MKFFVSKENINKLFTLGSSPKTANWASVSIDRVVFIRSLHFFGVSSVFPAKNKQHAAVTYYGKVKEHPSLKTFIIKLPPI